ncbi:MAG: AtpZ/AtpI family protein [Dehalococcoidia bacterium]|nr:AtpZ/AtpI family protein [Dehalococcoidia bacterium]
MGWVFVACIGAGLAAGIWLDSRTGISPLFTLLGLFSGMGAGFVGMFRMISSVYEEEEDDTMRKRK